VDIYLYKGEKTELHHFFVLPQKAIKETRSPFKLDFGNGNFISKDKNKIEVFVLDKRVILEMHLQNDAPSEKVLQTSLLPKEYPDDGFYWKVFAPHCSGKARIKFDGKEISLQGPAYHDFNGGSANLKQILKYWYWGKYAFDGQLFIYGEITTREEGTRRIALLAADGQVQMDENPRRKEQDGTEHYATRMGEFVFCMGERKQIDAINFSMSTLNSSLATKILEILFQLSARLPGFSHLHRRMENAHYHRYRSNGVCDDGRPVKTFYEEMFL